MTRTYRKEIEFERRACAGPARDENTSRREVDALKIVGGDLEAIAGREHRRLPDRGKAAELLRGFVPLALVDAQPLAHLVRSMLPRAAEFPEAAWTRALRHIDGVVESAKVRRLAENRSNDKRLSKAIRTSKSVESNPLRV